MRTEKGFSYYLSGILWMIVLSGMVGAAGYFAGNGYKEYRAAKKLKDVLGFLPGDSSHNQTAYSRKLNFYTVSQNTPNFNFEAYDSDFHKTAMVSDSNGFITGGPALSIQKQPRTVRIFITGGSGAFGSIQAHNEVNDTYPGGTYAYNASIAGYLKKILEKQFPDLKFEVINAAVVQHLFNQNFAMYFEKIHDFKPDIIISLDGWNDAGLFLFSKHNGNPYQMTDKQSDEALTLELLSRYCSSYSSILENLQGRAKSKEAGNSNKAETNIPFVDLNERDYKKIEPLYVSNAQKLLWLYSSYLQQLKHDSIYAIVALQPMLERREMNKKLSPLELKFRTIIEYNEFKGAAGSFNQFIGNNEQGYFNGMGNEKFNVINFIDAYFFDSYFTDKLSDIANREGSVYVDMGKEIESMGPEKEFFVDYCHMTPYGNYFTANVFAQRVSAYLQQRNGPVNLPR